MPCTQALKPPSSDLLKTTASHNPINPRRVASRRPHFAVAHTSAGLHCGWLRIAVHALHESRAATIVLRRNTPAAQRRGNPNHDYTKETVSERRSIFRSGGCGRYSHSGIQYLTPPLYQRKRFMGGARTVRYLSARRRAYRSTVHTYVISSIASSGADIF